MESEILRVCRRPIRSARPPQTKAPTIIPRYTIRPGERKEDEDKMIRKRMEYNVMGKDNEKEKRDSSVKSLILLPGFTFIRFPVDQLIWQPY